MGVRPTQSRGGVKGGFPLAGSRDSVPCGAWGSAPTVPRPTNPKRKVNKAAGSEASLPVTLRVLRRAPKLLPSTSMLCRADGRDRIAGLATIAALSRKQGISPLRRRQGGNGNRRSLRSPPLEPFGRHPCLLTCIGNCLERNHYHEL